MPSADDRDKKAAGDAGSAAWTTGSGTPTPETESPPEGNDAGRPETGPHGPETDHRGTDQESIAPGRSKPASEPAEDAPPGTIPGVPDQEGEGSPQ